MSRLVIGAAIGVAVGVIVGAALGLHAQTEPTEETHSAAVEAGVDELDLQGAVNSTGLGPRDYLIGVGELAAPDPPLVRAPSLDYLLQRYGPLGSRIWCVMGVESRWGSAMWNPLPWGRFGEHAQGWAGWLPSTWRTTPPGRRGVAIGDFYSEAEGVAWMLQVGRGREFFGVAAGRC
jgi:hypothetical protein